MRSRPNTPPATRKADSGLADFSPASFGIVMATGILSLASDALGLPRLARALFVANVCIYAALWSLTALRALRHPRRLLADLNDHVRGFGFFTTVAATGILGSQCVVLAGSDDAGFGLWCVALALWALLTYAILAALVVKRDKPTLADGIGGSWLLAVVATQSISVLGALLAGHARQPARMEIDYVALGMWLWGGMLYIWIGALIFYRWAFLPLAPADLSPPYWINMGAMAISTLAGSLLAVHAPGAPLLTSLLPFIKGFTLFYWATGTWWIPLLLVLGVWRHAYRRFPLRYDPLYWSLVFPLGMYAASTHAMIGAMGLDFLAFLPPVFLSAGLLAGALAYLGLGLELWSRLKPQRWGDA
jgi:tellurite resistance protein TehA-like permease